MSATTKEEIELIEDDVQSHGATDVSDDRGTDGELSDEEVDDEANNKETSGKEANNDQAADKETDEKKAVDQMVDDDKLPDEAASVHSASTASAIDTNAEADENYSHPLGDLHRLGLEVVKWDDKDYISYDIVAVHGLHGRSRAAWMENSHGGPYATWLDSHFSNLPSRVGRIMMYGYDPGDRSSKAWTSYGIFKEAEAFLEALAKFRRPEIRETRRPIWFVSQDIGGLIVKAALVLASRNESKYSDILHCTRSLVFFNYPHRYVSRGYLEEAISRHLTSLRWRPHPWNLLRATKSLSQTIIEVNDAFIHTQLITQANLVNISPIPEEATIFPPFMTSMDLPFEIILRLDRPHSLLTTPLPETAHEFCQLPTVDWLMGDLPDRLHPSLRQLINQIPPIYPYQKPEANYGTSFPELNDFLKSGPEKIVHLRCLSNNPCATGRVAQRARMFLQDMKVQSRPLFYFSFNAHDIRFNNVSPMLQTFVAQILFNRLKDRQNEVKVIVEQLHTSGRRTLDDLFSDFEYLRGRPELEDSIHVLGCFDGCDESSLWFISRLREFVEQVESSLRFLIITTHGTDKDEALASALSEFPPGMVTSVEYEPPQPHLYVVNQEASLIVQERPYFARNDREDAIKDLLSKCKGDEQLCEIIADWLGSAPNPFESGAELFESDDTPSPEAIFRIVLAEIPSSRIVWAHKLLCWVSSSLRPLRLEEFCWVSDHLLSRANVESEEYDTWSNFVDILGYFYGLLEARHGEIHFKHAQTRSWLLAQDDDTVAPAGYSSGAERNDVLLEMCLKCIENEAAHDAVACKGRFPYADEFWTYHYQHASTACKNLAKDLIQNQPVFERWLEVNRSLPTQLPKPRPETSTLLAVAAHFNLLDILKDLLADSPDTDARGQALVEAARVGSLAAINLILESYVSDFDFDDEVLHEAVQEASFSENSEVLKKLVDCIPTPPYSIPKLEREERLKAAQAGGSSDGQNPKPEPEEPTDGAVDNSQEVQNEDPDLPKEKTEPEEPHDPFLWLARPLLEASRLGLDDTIVKLLSVGADPNPKKGTNLRDKTPLHVAASYSHISSIELLIDAGVDVNRPDAFGYSPLWGANSGPVITTLVDNGANIDGRTPNTKVLPIQSFSRWGSFVALETILDYRHCHEYFDDTQPDLHPVDLATQFQRKKCLDILLRHGLKTDFVNQDSKSPLWLTINYGRIDMCRALLENGADPNFAPDGAQPALHKAVNMQRIDIMDLLIEHKADIDKVETPGEGWARTPLNAALDWKYSEQVLYLVEHGANPNVKDIENLWALFVAAQNGDNNVVRKLVEAGADLNPVSDTEKWTPVHAAFKNPETVALLIELGADLTILTASDYTPLDIALSNGQRGTMETILEKSKIKFDLSLRGAQKALVYAVDDNYVDAVEAILEAGADVNTVDVDYEFNRNEPLIGSALRSDSEAMVRKLLEFRPDLNLVSEKQNTVLHCISGRTPVASVRLLVNAGARLDVLNSNRETPLAIAADHENDEVFKYILTKEAARSVLHVTPREQGSTAMHVVCLNGKPELVKLLLGQKFDVNFACDGLWGTPLISAVIGPSAEDRREDKREVIELLLKEGADPNKAAGYYGYPIIAVCLTGRAEFVQLVLDQGVSLDVKDPLSRKPTHAACYNTLDVLNLLKVPDSAFITRDAVGRVPLHYAVCTGQTDLVEEVLARSARVGVDINVKDNDGWTPLLWAARSSLSWRQTHGADVLATDVVALLLEKGADPNIKGMGFSAPFSASQVAYYHEADAIGDLIASKEGKEPPKTKKRGRRPPGGWWCDVCLLDITGSYFKCDECLDFAVCFKCSRSRSQIHPRHSFRDEGEEWDDNGMVESVKSEAGDNEAPKVDGEADDEDVSKPEDEGSSDGFDDEIVG
ncbi:hypothetical protein NW762_014528 [Fusarium torreyae]|uniref:Ankyrin 1 n=1 Tax=Fusarium torreyae TaxID=1237075 RepID=A0A9W8RLJ6_9HYPO|nr:hypothetical protein NW762_014528 [Fusarium torreyae]